MNVVREFVKLSMFTVLWALPVIVAKLFDSPWYLWLFVGSFFATLGIFTHYEDLEKIKNSLKKGVENEA